MVQKNGPKNGLVHILPYAEKYWWCIASERLSIYVALLYWLSHLSLFQGKISEVKQRNIVPMIAL